MKRGERQMWRKLVSAINDLVESDDYAEEYIARRRVEKCTDDLVGRNFANLVMFRGQRAK